MVERSIVSDPRKIWYANMGRVFGINIANKSEGEVLTALFTEISRRFDRACTHKFVVQFNDDVCVKCGTRRRRNAELEKRIATMPEPECMCGLLPAPASAGSLCPIHGERPSTVAVATNTNATAIVDDGSPSAEYP